MAMLSPDKKERELEDIRSYIEESDIQTPFGIDAFLYTPLEGCNNFSIASLVMEGHGNAVRALLKGMARKHIHDFDAPLEDQWPTLKDIERNENLIRLRREKTWEEIDLLIRGSAKAHNLRSDFETVINAEYVGDWLHQPNDAFGGKSPWQMIREGKGEEIRAAFYRLVSGEPT